jgi:hypothetical protein
MKPEFNKIVVLIFLQFFVCFNTQTILGQEVKDDKKNLKNSVKINLTNPMIFGQNCFMIGYERTIGAHKSFSFNIGRFSIPLSLDINNNDLIKDVTSDINHTGFHFIGDYRFYLSKENKYNSPRGVYIGPYVTYNAYSHNFKFSINDQAYTGNVNADFKCRIASVGFQMGYQLFVFS